MTDPARAAAARQFLKTITQAIARLRATRLLPIAWVPASLQVWETPLPCGATGKVDRRQLTAITADKLSQTTTEAGPAPQLNTLAPPPPPLDPGTPFAALFAAVEEVWSDLLGPAAGAAPHASFSALGGDSLLAMRGATRLKAILAPPPPPDVDPDAEAARAIGRLSSTFAPSRLLLADSKFALTLSLAEELGVALDPAAEKWKRSVLQRRDSEQEGVGDTPAELLQTAARHDCVLAIDALLDADVPLCDVDGGWTRQNSCFTPLHAAARAGSCRAIEVRAMAPEVGAGGRARRGDCWWEATMPRLTRPCRSAALCIFPRPFCSAAHM